MTKNLQETTKSGNSKVILVIIIAFLMLPILTVSILYLSNENFKYKANDYLVILPGRLGDYFENQPTREEKEELKSQIAKHYITLEEDRIVDKLLLIKSDDIKLYSDLLVQLNRLNPKKMGRVKDELRRKEVNGDILFQIVEEIGLENNERIDSLVRYYSSLGIIEAVTEMQNAFERNEISIDDLVMVFERLPLGTSARIISLVNSELSDRIKYMLPVSIRRDIDKQINENNFKENELIRIAKIYEEKAIDDLVDEIGNNKKFRLQDLAIIYSNMSYKKSGEVLARVDDQEFIFSLYDHIERYNEIHRGNDNISVKLAKSVQTLKDYNSKVIELATIYQRMPRADLAKIVDQMMRSNEVVIRQSIDSNETITFTQQQLIIDVLNQFKSNVVTEIMGHLDTRRATELSKKLVE